MMTIARHAVSKLAILRAAPTDADPAAQIVVAPTVGVVSDLAEAGQRVEPGHRLGTITILGRPHDLLLPATSPAVFVTGVIPEDWHTNVGFGAPLLHLGTPSDEAGTAAAMAGTPGATGAAAGSDAPPEGMIGVRTGTVGTFYHRPAPDQPAYVEVGQTIRPGTTIGLVEVMKVFNPLRYDGTTDVVVRKLLVDDGGEVRSGQTVAWLEPAS